MSWEKARELDKSLTWFVNEVFPGELDRRSIQIATRPVRDLPNFFESRIRVDNPHWREKFEAIKAATEFYAGQIDPEMKVDFT